ncbi:MAG: hypothetical protein JWO21_1119, partial [Solirubrobacterales bacterium]|nr:hypothetical protein [Solirubrobacterales bacterium]
MIWPSRIVHTPALRCSTAMA